MCGKNRNWVSLTVACCAIIFFLSRCEAEEPIKEDIPELITKVILTFTRDGGGAFDVPVVATATDPDGDGVQDITVNGAITLNAGTIYTLRLSLFNELAEQTSPEYNLTNEIEEEGDEHMFFFGWTNNVFSDPTGDGNIDNRVDQVSYLDSDENGLPIGITTFWITGNIGSGKFRLILKHQPQLKTITSDVNAGETDLDVVFDMIVN